MISARTLRPILQAQLDPVSNIVSDSANIYQHVGAEYPHYNSVNHTIGEYVRGDASTNTIEGYFSIMKRGIVGTYHHVSATHLKRYLAEFDFRYNERSALGVIDEMRFEKSIPGIVGKRMTYRRVSSRADA